MEIEKVREIFSEDRFATENGVWIDEVGDNYARCSLKLERRHRNAMGAVMGGAYFMLADFVFAVASNWQKMSTVSLHSDINFLGAAKGESLTAEAFCIKDGKTTCCYRMEIKDEMGSMAAVVTTTGYHKN